MNAIRFFAALAILALSPLAALADGYGWDTYANARFGYSVALPMGLYKMRPPPENDDGRTFISHDGRSLITVFGGHNALGLTPQQYAAFLRRDPGFGRVTYEVVKKDWLVLSGYRPSPFSDSPDEQIFYVRVMFNEDRSSFSSFDITYPQGDRQRFDRIVTHMSETLTPPGEN